MNVVTETILRRQSCRSFDSKAVNPDTLQEILKCGQAAPSGSNNQSVHFYVIKSAQKIMDLHQIVEEELERMEHDNAYAREQNQIRKHRYEHINFVYGAPVLIVLTNLKNYPNAMADCVCANENMMIAATALGLGSCYINQLHWLDDSERIRSFLGLPDQECICCALALGHMNQNRVLSQNRRIFGNPIHYLD